MSFLSSILIRRLAIRTAERFRREVEEERSQLDRSSLPFAPAMLVRLTNERAVWRVLLPGMHPRYLCVQHGYDDNDRFVVHVSGDRLYRLWLDRVLPVDDPGRIDECVLRKDMSGDGRFSGAAEQFDHGYGHSVDQPVPLAECDCVPAEGGRPMLRFRDGVSRTFWLLAHRANSFPVEVGSEDAAHALDRAAGTGTPPCTVLSVLRQAREGALAFPIEDAQVPSDETSSDRRPLSLVRPGNE